MCTLKVTHYSQYFKTLMGRVSYCVYLLYFQYDQLDAEHKGLFQGVFDCAGAPGDKGKFDGLFGKCKAHFDSEEVRRMVIHTLC